MGFSFLILLSLKGFFDPWGKDCELIPPKKETHAVSESENYFAASLESVILFHQNVLSPIDGPRSHFRPTSSRYTLLSIRRYGPLLGIIKGCDRLMRENNDPWLYRKIIIDDIEYKWDPTY